MAKYYSRAIEAQITKKMQSSGALAIEGPKFCGKTTTAMRYGVSCIRLNTRQAIEMAELEPAAVLQGERPRVVDEWQTVPDIWNQVKAWIDEHPGFGQFILTGSATPANKEQIHHSGAGRIARLTMRPMSLQESEESSGTISLGELFEDADIRVFDENRESDLARMAFLLCRGGWPLSVVAGKDIGLEVTRNYYDGLFSFEYSENEKFRNKKPELMRMILRSYARNISAPTPKKTLLADVAGNNNRTLDIKTLDAYLEALRDLFIIEDVEAWNPNLRSKAVIRTTPIRHFVDTSVAAAVLGVSPDHLLKDLHSFGLFFEDMAIRDMRIYAEQLGGQIRHYRDSSGLECDAILLLDNGDWAAIEIKLGGEKLVEEASAHLNRLGKLVDQRPAFKMIITATGPAYRRRDGIIVAPLNCLKA